VPSSPELAELEDLLGLLFDVEKVTITQKGGEFLVSSSKGFFMFTLASWISRQNIVKFGLAIKNTVTWRAWEFYEGHGYDIYSKAARSLRLAKEQIANTEFITRENLDRMWRGFQQAGTATTTTATYTWRDQTGNTTVTAIPNTTTTQTFTLNEGDTVWRAI